MDCQGGASEIFVRILRARKSGIFSDFLARAWPVQGHMEI